MTGTHAAMGRREAMRVLGEFGCGMTAATNAACAGDHGVQQKDDSEFKRPVQGLHAHFCGIHVAKGNPGFQVVAQHYCSARSKSMHQCLLYDSCEENAKLRGVEYIIVDAAYRRLTETEKKYWHPLRTKCWRGDRIAGAPRLPAQVDRPSRPTIDRRGAGCAHSARNSPGRS
jgi:Protein of unknown function (DUF1264)